MAIRTKKKRRKDAKKITKRRVSRQTWTALLDRRPVGPQPAKHQAGERPAKVEEVPRKMAELEKIKMETMQTGVTRKCKQDKKPERTRIEEIERLNKKEKRKQPGIRPVGPVT